MAAMRSGTTLAARWRRRALVRTLVSMPLVLLTFLRSSLATLPPPPPPPPSDSAISTARRAQNNVDSFDCYERGIATGREKCICRQLQADRRTESAGGLCQRDAKRRSRVI
jgi:hypothetical protein